jgi:hypothetical protein
MSSRSDPRSGRAMPEVREDDLIRAVNQEVADSRSGARAGLVQVRDRVADPAVVLVEPSPSVHPDGRVDSTAAGGMILP